MIILQPIGDQVHPAKYEYISQTPDWFHSPARSQVYAACPTHASQGESRPSKEPLWTEKIQLAYMQACVLDMKSNMDQLLSEMSLLSGRVQSLEKLILSTSLNNRQEVPPQNP